MFYDDNQSFQADNSQDCRRDLAFRPVFQQYYEPLCLFADRLMGGRQLAEDIVADVFLKLWEKQPDFNLIVNPKALLFIAVKNACFNQINNHKRNQQGQFCLAYLNKNAVQDFVLNDISRCEAIQQLQVALNKLPPECKKVMQLYFIDGWDYRKISQHLGISVSTTRNHKCNGLRALRKKLGNVLFFFMLFNEVGNFIFDSLRCF